jgi:hypothetical protein
MPAEVRFALHPDSIKDRSFLLELYLRRTGDGLEIGVANRRSEDYAWAVIPFNELDAALALLRIEDQFDATRTP